MCAVYLAARLLYRDRAMTNALGAAAFGLLVFDPRQLFTASFQMTFLCVLIVAAIGIPMLERTSQHYRQALTIWDSKDYAVFAAAAGSAVSPGPAVDFGQTGFVCGRRLGCKADS
jgi:competence protein ComEC